jgi:SAM-dependent methyltransferase
MTQAFEFEKKYVYDVYDKIAQKFSLTRYKPWGKVRNFISSIDEKSLIGDIGCGNGKNMKLRPKQFMGCDMSSKFVEICQNQGLNVVNGNILNIPFKSETFDYAICIAVIHHLSSEERRLQAIEELSRIMKPKGQIMIQVWALEQDGTSNHKFTEQDTMVTWGNDKIERFYHVFKKGELEELINKNKKIKIIESFYECGNWGVIIEKLPYE